MKDSYRGAIIGAGLAGLGMAMRLTAAGDNSFIIQEKSDRIGGTWRDTTCFDPNAYDMIQACPLQVAA